MKFPIHKLGDLCRITSGGTPSRTKTQFFGGGVPWVTITDMLQVDVTRTKETLSKDGIANSSAKLLPAGTVLISIFATIGRTAILQIDAATNQAIAGVIPNNPQQLDSRYLKYFLDSKHGFLNSEARGVAQPNINQGILKSLEIELPPLPEQLKIVDLLARAENIVRLRRESQQKAAELVPAIFLEMFGNPVVNPKGWPVVPLGQVSDVQGGLQVTTKRAAIPLEAPYLRVANVYRSRLDLKEIKSIRLTVAESQRTRLEVGDLLFVEGHGNPQEVGRCAVWDGSIDGCTHQNHLIRARPDQTKLLPEFACASLNSVSGRRTLVDTGKTTSGLSTISAQNVKQAKLMLPPLSLQELFKQRANDAGSISAQQDAATEKAQSVFNALLAQSFK